MENHRSERTPRKATSNGAARNGAGAGNGKVKAAVYLRRSREDQDASIEGQRSEVMRLAKEGGYAVAPTHVFVDDGISGDKTEKRTGFLAMRDAAARGEFSAVLCWDAARFGRFDSIDAGYWIKPIRDAGVYLHTVKEGVIDWRTAEGRIVYGVTQDGGRNAYLTGLSRDVTRGMLLALEEGSWCGAPPYGYSVHTYYVDPKTKKQKLVPVPERVPTVRWLFEQFARRGRSIYSLTVELNNNGVPSPTNAAKGWCPSTIRKILTCRTYLGEICWNRTNQSRYFTITGRASRPRTAPPGKRANPPGDWVWVRSVGPDEKPPHERLIDDETFALAQERLARIASEKRRDRTPAGGPVFLFSGLVRCGRCGSAMHAHRNQKRKGFLGPEESTAYVCSGGHQHGPKVCRCLRVFENDLAHVLAAVVDNAIKPKPKKEWVAEVERRLEEARADPRELDRARKALADLDRNIEQGYERYLTAPPSLTAGLAAKIDQWRAERDAAAERVAALEQAAASAGDVRALAKEVVGRLHLMHLALITGDDAARREVFQSAVERVTVDFRDVPIPDAKKAARLAAQGKPYTPKVKGDITGYRVKLRPEAFTVRNLVPGVIRLDVATWPRPGPPCSPGTPAA